ncbi:hypothetical protein BGZ76_010747 [Entomortierella beljakovae]|nr:hypothetical protein BGZ76_010747 [Entomortierella beljakovae]
MSTPPLSPSATSPNDATSPQISKRKLSRAEYSKPNESWFLILVNAFKSNFEQTLTYRESELYSWIMQEYPYYRHDMNTMQSSVKTTLSSYECFRQNGRSTWTFIPRRALVHLESLKSEESRGTSDQSDVDNEEMFEDDENEIVNREHGESSGGVRYEHMNIYEDRDRFESYADGSDTKTRYVDKHLDLMDEDSPTLSVEEIQRFKQEHSGAHARKLKRKASGGHQSRPRTRSPPIVLQDECSMSMEAWCNLLVQMFEASPKQKTIREIYTWVHDNYPVYRDAPGDEWQKDLAAALESNPLFKAMGRGRWQMLTQAQPMIIVNGVQGQAGTGLTGNLIEKEDDDETDSPSVTEDEDWKAIGSKRLLNFSFRRYSIATDTFPKSHYKEGSTTPANSNSQQATTETNLTAISVNSGPSMSTEITGNSLLPLDQRVAAYNTTGRRYSSYHQPTPKNSPPLSATITGLLPVEEFSAQLKNALSEETDDEEIPTRRYIASSSHIADSNSFDPQSTQPYIAQNQLKSSILPTSSTLESSVNPQHQQPKTFEYSLSEHSSNPSDIQESLTIKPRVEPEIVMPNGEDLASDQMDAIQALALLCGGGV